MFWLMARRIHTFVLFIIVPLYWREHDNWRLNCSACGHSIPTPWADVPRLRSSARPNGSSLLPPARFGGSAGSSPRCGGSSPPSGPGGRPAADVTEFIEPSRSARP
jgi:hypothetical protein